MTESEMNVQLIQLLIRFHLDQTLHSGIVLESFAKVHFGTELSPFTFVPPGGRQQTEWSHSGTVNFSIFFAEMTPAPGLKEPLTRFFIMRRFKKCVE